MDHLSRAKRQEDGKTECESLTVVQDEESTISSEKENLDFCSGENICKKSTHKKQYVICYVCGLLLYLHSRTQH